MRLPQWPAPLPPLRPMSRDKADTLLLLAACALVLAPHAWHLPWWTSLICAVLLLWRGWLTFNGNRMPPRWILLPVALLSMAGVYASYRTLLGREPGVAMLVLLLAFKLLEMRAKRDLFVVIFLSFFLILTNFFYSQTMGTALLMVVALVALLSAQLSFQYTGSSPPLMRRLGLGALILALAAPLTLIMFILFPRIQGPLWGLPADAHGPSTGLSDNMTPGAISDLALSGAIAFRVKFADPAPTKSRLYWRGPVLGHYDGRSWTPLPARFDGAGQRVLRVLGAPVRYQVTLEPNGRRSIFALELPQAAPEIAGGSARIMADRQILSRQPVDQRIRYDAVSYLDFALQPDASTAALEQWKTLPAGYNPRTLEFAAQLRRQSADNMDMVRAVLKFFRDEKFSYTLSPPLLGRDAMDEFLFSTRAGFCEHYASAFVVLMRALGIPARVVTGYQGGEMNRVDGFMTVRQSDAHAWAEVWLDRRGWVRVDPTAAIAPNRIERNLNSVLPPSLLGGLMVLGGDRDSWFAGLQGWRQGWDALNNAWNQWVLDYTPARQKSFIQSLGFGNADWRMLVALMFALGTAAMALIALPLLAHRRNIDPADALYFALCRRLAQRGYPRALHEGPRAYGGRLAVQAKTLAPDKLAAAIRFLELYESVRYGPPAMADTVHKKKQWTATINQLKTLLARSR